MIHPNNPMTLIRTTLALLLAGSSLTHAGDFIRQTQLKNGLTWDFHPASNLGSTWSPIPVGTGGSVFSLYATGNKATPRIIKLDESTMGTAFPTVELTIRSQDPHVPARTRADQPFSVKIKRHGASQKLISLRHTLEKYNPATHSNNAQAAPKNVWLQLPIKTQQSGKFYPSIPSPVPTLAEGEETFTAYATGVKGKQLHPLKSASVQVWPVASVSITGIRANATVKSTAKLNKVTVSCRNLYPDSVTYVQIYRGNARLGTLGRILPQTVIRFDTKVPQNQKIPLGNWADTLPDGQYTLEVLHITPFNQRKPERLGYASFVIDRGMHASGLVMHQL